MKSKKIVRLFFFLITEHVHVSFTEIYRRLHLHTGFVPKFNLEKPIKFHHLNFMAQLEVKIRLISTERHKKINKGKDQQFE